MKLLTTFFILTALIIAGCGQSAPPQGKTKMSQAQKAAKAAESIKFTENAEIDNIKKRLELTSDPGLLGYVALLNRMGQPVLYAGVEGKITSGGKRLTQGQRLQSGDGGEFGRDFVMNSPSDEGTWGSSNPYVYFWTVTGQYFQTNMHYLYSDQPFRLREQPLVILDAETVTQKDAPPAANTKEPEPDTDTAAGTNASANN